MSEPELNLWEKALGWRKRQMIQRQLDPISNKIRNDTIEEVAKEFAGKAKIGKHRRLTSKSRQENIHLSRIFLKSD